MAIAPEPNLLFQGSCPDCGVREIDLPQRLPQIGDDFDWLVRDYDGFRMFMLEALAAKFPERKRWTPADMEVVLIEVLAMVLDQMSDMADRASAEAYLESARRPDSVRRLLALIGFDAVNAAKANKQIDDTLQGKDAEHALELFWSGNHQAMQRARYAGPAAIQTQKRMVTVEDYKNRLEEHPLVLDAHAWSQWSGSWTVIHVAVINWNQELLDKADVVCGTEMWGQVEYFHTGLAIKTPDLDQGSGKEPLPIPSIRMVLRPYLDAFRMAGQEVFLEDAEYVGIYLSISIRVGPHFFQSEAARAVRRELSKGPGAFFQPGRMTFGEDLYASDIIEALMKLDGVENVCLNRFKRLGKQYRDRAGAGFISLNGLEVAVCDNNMKDPDRGYFHLTMNGGRTG